jgi:hypothetical protein
MTLWTIVILIGLGTLAIIALFLGRLVMTAQKGLAEVLRGMSSLDERLENLEKLLSERERD